MSPNQANLQRWTISFLLAIATSLGSFVTLSIAESLNSEESKVELTELVEIEVDSEEKIVENRDRRIKRRSIAIRRSDTGQLHKPTKSDISLFAFPSRLFHNGCGSHLRI